MGGVIGRGVGRRGDRERGWEGGVIGREGEKVGGVIGR